MASSSTNLVLFPCLFLACLLFTFSNNLVVARESDDKVKLNLYYESLCPGCQNFIVNDLVRIFNSDLHKIIDLKLVPFGNAELSDDLNVTCQHGEEECKLNALEACAINTWPNPKMHYWFIWCVENNSKNWESCVKNSRREKTMGDCYNGNLSKELILKNAEETITLNPPLVYVPWITLNDKPLDEDSPDDWVAQICKAYKGKNHLPKICNSSDLMSKSPERKVWKLQRSYANKAINH